MGVRGLNKVYDKMNTHSNTRFTLYMNFDVYCIHCEK